MKFTFGDFKTDVSAMIEDTSPTMFSRVRGWTNQALDMLGKMHDWRTFRKETTLTPATGIITVPTDMLMLMSIRTDDEANEFYEKTHDLIRPRTYFYEPGVVDAATGAEKFTLYDDSETLWSDDVLVRYRKQHARISAVGALGTAADAELIFYPARNALFWLVMQMAHQNRMYMADALQIDKWVADALRGDIFAEASTPRLKIPQGYMGQKHPFAFTSRRKEGGRY